MLSNEHQASQANHENPRGSTGPGAIFRERAVGPVIDSDKCNGLYNHVLAPLALSPSVPVSFSVGGPDDDCHNGHAGESHDNTPRGKT